MDFDNKKTYCRFCLGSCGLDVSRKDNKYRIKADRANPISSGYICNKCVNAGSFYKRKNRVSDFLIYGSKVTQRSFFENLPTKVKGIIESYGSDAVGVYFGTNAILDAVGIWSGMGFLYRINSKSFFYCRFN